MKFICDAMLVRLGKWLRAAGYDTLIADASMSDKFLVNLAMQETRILLTRDSKIREIRHAHDVAIYLRCNDTEACLKELGKCCHINWLFRPFSRCMKCNSPLQSAEPQQYKLIPEKSRPHVTKLLFCPVCQKLYWHGSHVDRMYEKLQSWQQTFN